MCLLFNLLTSHKYGPLRRQPIFLDTNWVVLTKIENLDFDLNLQW